MNPLFAAVVRGIEDGLREGGYTPLIANTDNDAERERIAYEAMSARQVDGFIAATARRDHWLLADQVRSGVKVVLVNRRVDSDALPAVTGDDHAGIRLAVEHLAARAPADRPSGRLAGALYGLVAPPGLPRRDEGARARARPRPDRVQRGVHRARGRALLRRAARPAGATSPRSWPATTCWRSAATTRSKAHGLRCPDDVSVVGYNDMPFVDRFRPPLTTVRVPHYELGATAAAADARAAARRRSAASPAAAGPRAGGPRLDRAALD